MTAAEKTIIYTFLSSAEAYTTAERIQRPIPRFLDDREPPEAGPPCLCPTLAELEDAVRHCTLCPRAQIRHQALTGCGPQNAANQVSVMVIGPEPNRADEEAEQPFSGESGQLLDKMLSAINLSRTSNCYLTTVVKCRSETTAFEDSLPRCRPFLERQLQLLRPRLILLLGSQTARSLTDSGGEIETEHGRFFELSSVPAMITFHPDQLLSDASLKRPVWEDLKRFRARLDDLERNV